MPTMEPERDIIQPIASEEARAAYLEEHMKNIGGVQLPSSIPSKVEESSTSAEFARRIDIYCNKQKKRRQERESHKQTLDALKERKKQQLKKPNKEENKAVYSQIAQNMEKTRDVV